MCFVVAERGAKKIGEIFDRAFGLLRPLRNQARDRVHAVEQKVRANARLQRIESRLRFGANARAPLFEHVEVAQQRRTDQRAKRGVAPHESRLELRRQGQAEIEPRIDREYQLAAEHGDQKHQSVCNREHRPRARAVPECGRNLHKHTTDTEREPLHEDDVAVVRRGMSGRVSSLRRNER